MSSTCARLGTLAIESSHTSAPRRRYGGKSHEERRAERRERLLDAGLELFGTRGYGQTTIEMICATARLNPRYFYEEFESREELLAAVYDRHIDAITNRVVTSVAQAPLDPLERLQVGLRTFLDGILADPLGARINYFEMLGVSPQLEEKRRGVLSAYADLVASQISEIDSATPIPIQNHRLAAVAMVGATDGLIIDALANGRGENRDEIITTLLELVDSILRRPSQSA